MTMPKDEIQSQLNDAWMQNFDSLEKSVDQLENYIKEAKGMAGIFTDEWCEVTKQVMDDLNNALFSISESRTADPELSFEDSGELQPGMYDYSKHTAGERTVQMHRPDTGEQSSRNRVAENFN